MIWASLALAGNLGMKDLTPCSGEEIPAGTKVTVHYVGRLESGEVFDSSRERGRPLTFPLGLGRLIEGWEIGMQGMSVGCTREIVVPPELGYGDRDMGKVPPGSTLTFEIELLGIEAAEPEAPAAPTRPPPPSAPPDVPSLEKTDSGIRYHDLVVGTGEAPFGGKTATVEYSLWLEDGTLVDSSYKRDEPFAYKVGRGRVIDGWEEAVLGMHVGGKRYFVVPWKLAYGRQGRPPTIPRKADLVFVVELLSLH